MNVRVGTAPDSWGVWFPNDDRQPPWSRFLDEVVEAGYESLRQNSARIDVLPPGTVQPE